MEIQAQELFYSRVEAAYSPAGKSGYQTVYHSPGLSEQQIRAVERHIKCFDGKYVECGYQFFHIAENKSVFVISQLLHETDVRITDRSGRPGAFIAHALIMGRTDCQRIDYNPFVIFDAADFFTLDPHEMVAIKGDKPEHRVLNLEQGTETVDYEDLTIDISSWQQEEFGKLWQLAIDARQLTQNQRSVQWVSDDEGLIYDWLRLIFGELPAHMRDSCTFNTHVDNCLPFAGTYWSVGVSSRISHQSYIPALVDRGKVNYTVSPAVKQSFAPLYRQLRHSQGYSEEN